jgi:glycolate oxidase FAD binding subunit
MSSVLRPDTAAGVVDAIAWAAAEEVPLEVLGHGSKRALGRPVQAEYTLDLSRLTGVTLYEPEELVLSARAGTPLGEIEKLLREQGQELAFEPMDYGPVLGGEPGLGTLGGMLAANVSGPRRIKAGAARDHILGIQAVSGRGEAFKSGGRVVKNVTGYDLSRGLAGSWGTLAVATQLTFKVLPRPESSGTLAVVGLDDRDAIAVLSAAIGSQWEVSGAAHAPADVVPDLPIPAGGRPITLLRLEGFAPSVAYRADKLADMFRQHGEIARLDGVASEELWRAIRDAVPFAGSSRPLWRASVAPTAGPALVGALRAQTAIRALYDWSGGLVWIEVAEDSQDALAGPIRSAVRAVGGGHAMLVRASPAIRAAVPPFESQEPALAALAQRLRESFDPKGILNPGRMTI